MSDTTRIEDTYPGDLQLDQDLALQRREWRWQRAGWGVMVLLVLLALLGFTGFGPFSHTRVAVADPGVVVEYQRVNRFRTSSELRLKIEKPRPDFTLSVPAAVADRVLISQITPEPTATHRSDEHLRLEYRDLQLGEHPLLLTIEYEPVRVGRLRGVLLLDDQPAVDLQSIILP